MADQAHYGHDEDVVVGSPAPTSSLSNAYPSFTKTLLSEVLKGVVKLGSPDQVGTSGWNSWSESMKDAFEIAGLEGIITGSEPQPSSDSIDPTTVSDWKARDKYARILLRTYVADSEKLKVTSAPTARDVWTTLESAFAMTGDEALVVLLQRLFSMRASSYAAIPAFIADFKDVVNKLRAADSSGEPLVPDRLLPFVFLQALPDNSTYNNLRTKVRDSLDARQPCER